MNHRGKRIVALGCLLVSAAITSAKVTVSGGAAPPKLVNPSFEAAGDASDLAAGWGRWGDWFNREEGWTPVHSGHCILGYHHWEIPSAKDSGVYQDVTGAAKGTSYTFGIYASLDKARKPTNDAVSIELRLESTVDGSQQTVASKLYKVADLPPNDWQKLTVSGSANSDALRVLVIVTPSSIDGARGGALRFDDAFLELTNSITLGQQ
jgi:hypothetical protein